MREVGAELMGDLPFVVGEESADVWARPGLFLRDVTLGAPPDSFSTEGQNWGLPAYNWPAMDGTGLEWIRARTRHAARLYDRFRLDHAVGYFRMWIKPPGGRGRFEPAQEADQRARGLGVMRAILDQAEGSAHVVAEDLGLIPPFVRAILADLGVPGYRVIPWERDAARHFRDPHSFPPVSVASLSTHDTPPITTWWDDFSSPERQELARLGSFDAGAPASLRDLGLLGLLLDASSALSLMLVQEMLGTGERINTPGTVSDVNWTYRLPEPLEDLQNNPEVAARLQAIRGRAQGAGRD